MAVELSNPFPLTPSMIDQKVTITSPGVYALGYEYAGRFVVERVGRSDTDLNGRLKSDEYRGKYQSFRARYYPTAEAAYHAECELYHSHGGPNNPNHPAVPWGNTLKCNHCKHPSY